MPALFTRHAMLLQTAFSEVKRRAGELPRVLVGSPGSVGVRRVKGREFYYRQFYDAQGRKAAEYIGAVGDRDAEERASAVREQIVIAASLARDARTLTRHGYVRTDTRAGAIIASFANHALF